MRGLLRPSEGSVIIDGEDITSVRPSRLAGKIGYLFQNPDRQLCKTTIRGELAFTLEAAGVAKERREELIEKQLRIFGFDGEAEILTLSRGERQQVALCSAIAAEPEILLLDEPTTGLDYSESTRIMELVSEQNRRGVTVVMVCHDMEIVLDYAKSCIVLDKGVKRGEGTPRDIFYDGALLESASLLPPQLIELAQRFDGLGRPCTVTEFADAVENRRNGQ